MSKSNKPWPNLKTHEFEDKSARVTMRMPESQLAKSKAEAAQRGMKYQKFMRVLMERGLQSLGPL